MQSKVVTTTVSLFLVLIGLQGVSSFVEPEAGKHSLERGEEALPVARSGLWEIVAEQMRAGGATTSLGGGVESLRLCVTENGHRIAVQFPRVGHIVFELEAGPQEHHVATRLPNSFQGVTWVLKVESELELNSRISGDGPGAALDQRHVWRFVEEDPGVDYCQEG